MVHSHASWSPRRACNTSPQTAGSQLWRVATVAKRHMRASLCHDYKSASALALLRSPDDGLRCVRERVGRRWCCLGCWLVTGGHMCAHDLLADSFPVTMKAPEATLRRTPSGPTRPCRRALQGSRCGHVFADEPCKAVAMCSRCIPRVCVLSCFPNRSSWSCVCAARQPVLGPRSL